MVVAAESPSGDVYRMPTCRKCGAEAATEDLVRHRHHHMLVVHCPECKFVMGVWRDPTADDLAAAEESE